MIMYIQLRDKKSFVSFYVIQKGIKYIICDRNQIRYIIRGLPFECMKQAMRLRNKRNSMNRMETEL